MDSFLPLVMSARVVAPSELGGRESSGSKTLGAESEPRRASMSQRTHAAAAAHSSDSVALLLTREAGGISLCRPSSEYVSWPSVLLQIDRLPSCNVIYVSQPVISAFLNCCLGSILLIHCPFQVSNSVHASAVHKIKAEMRAVVKGPAGSWRRCERMRRVAWWEV